MVHKSDKMVSRRDFIKGAAAGAAGIAALGLLGACSGNEDSVSTLYTSAAETASSAAEGSSNTADAETTTSEASASQIPVAAATIDWLGEEPQISDKDIKNTYHCEVLVVGCGTAGIFAACAAAENGASTIVIDRFAEGSSSGIRDTLAAIDSAQQLEADKSPNKSDVVKMLSDYSHGYSNMKLHKLWADKSGEAIDWYTKLLEDAGYSFLFEYDDQDAVINHQYYEVGHSFQHGDAYNPSFTMGIINEYGKSLGIQYDFETTMVKLVKEEDRVTGVIAQTEDGYVKYEAAKGVIICTGGYSGNADMMEALQPYSVKMTCINYSMPGSKGDGIKACLWAGAKMDDVHTAMIFDRGAVKPDSIGGDGNGRLFWMGSQPFLAVNLLGERFTNESGPYDYILHASQEEPGQTYCKVWDETYEEDIQRFETHGCSRLYPHMNGAQTTPMSYINSVNEELMEEGYIVQADTIEQLAELLNLPADTFSESVKRYNELAANGADEDFGKESHRLSTLDTPPFYGVRMSGGYTICTMDGIKIDTNMNALDTQGNPIPGLYVCGDCSGSYFAASYPNLLSGAAAGRSTTFGRLAGQIAAQS